MTRRRKFFQDIYRNQAEQFDRLAAREDRVGNLFAALNEICPLPGLKVLEFGAGSGRLTRLLSLMVGRIHAFDIEPSMLRQAGKNLRQTGLSNWRLSLGDSTQMPVASNCADLVIEGWSFAHVVAWHPRDWLARSNAMLAEMERLLKPGGAAILIETMGIGKPQPKAPSAELARLYDYWQRQCGFAYRWIRTDFQFASPQEADELMRFFFGDELSDACLEGDTVIVPACTGIWWKQVPG